MIYLFQGTQPLQLRFRHFPPFARSFAYVDKLILVVLHIDHCAWRRLLSNPKYNQTQEVHHGIRGRMER